MTDLANRKHSRQRGAVLLEFALGSTVLVFLFFGVVDLGRVHQTAIEVHSAAHAGALYGSQSEAHSSQEAAIVTAARNDANRLSSDLAVTVQNPCQDASGVTVSCSQSGARRYVQVNVSYPFRTVSQLPFLPANLTLSRTAMIRVK